MDKISLNNEIVKMRPEAIKARVHTISKLNREVKRIRNLKNFPSDAQKQKLLQKADRHVEELLLMKKLKHDDISKFALTHSKQSATAILSNQISSLESKCLSKLAMHAGLSSRVETFRAQFPGWETTLVALLDSIGVKEKRSKVLARSLGLLKKSKVQQDEKIDNTSGGSNVEEESNSEHVAGDSNDSDLDEEIENDSDSESQQDEKDNDNELEVDTNTKQKAKSVPKSKQVMENKKSSKSLSVKVPKNTLTSLGEKLSKEQCIPYDDHLSSENYEDDELKPSVNLAKKLPVPDVKNKKVKKKKNEKDIQRDSKKSISNTSNSDSSKKSISNTSNGDSSIANKKTKKPVGPTVTRNKEMKVMRFTELMGSNKSTETVTESNDEPSAPLTTKTVDSFFVAGDGMSDFFSTVVLKQPTVVQKPTDHLPQEVYDSSGRRLNRREIRSRLHGNKGFKTFPPRPYQDKTRTDMWAQPDMWTQPNKPATSKWGKDKDTTASSQTKVFLPPIVEILHPSWEAKKKQKEQLNIVFQGKKIKFDD